MGSEVSLDRLFVAINFAVCKHRNQIRKDQCGSPYITHPLSVAQAISTIGDVQETHILVAAILHDTIEDTDTVESEILEQFGEDILEIILEVSDDKSLEKLERKRLQVVHAGELSYAAKVIKLADKLVNCRDILLSPPKDWSLARRQAYIQWAADVVYEIRGVNPALENAFDEMLHDAQEQLHFTIQPFKTVNQRPWAPDVPDQPSRRET
jgi:guanosine-3',5'-bis(diphosphate) 3'-pyrophosphohydrolase